MPAAATMRNIDKPVANSDRVIGVASNRLALEYELHAIVSGALLLQGGDIPRPND